MEDAVHFSVNSTWQATLKCSGVARRTTKTKARSRPTLSYSMAQQGGSGPTYPRGITHAAPKPLREMATHILNLCRGRPWLVLCKKIESNRSLMILATRRPVINFVACQTMVLIETRSVAFVGKGIMIITCKNVSQYVTNERQNSDVAGKANASPRCS